VPEKKPLSVAYDGVVYEVKALTKVISDVSSNQLAMVVRDPGKTENEIMLVTLFQFIEGFERREGEFVELKGPIILMSVKDWVDSFQVRK